MSQGTSHRLRRRGVCAAKGAPGHCVEGLPVRREVTDLASPSLWRHRDFLRLWAGQTVSQFGEQITMIALPLTAVLLLHASAFQMGILGAMATLPFLLTGLFVGVFVDRHRRRPVLVAADTARVVLLGLVPVLAALHRLTLVGLGTIAFATGVCTVLFDVAYQSYLPSLIGRDALVDGNSRLEASRALSQVAGPSVGGLLVQVLTAPLAVAANAATYVVSVLTLLAIRAPEPAPSPVAHESAWSAIRQGLRWVLGHPLLRAIAGCTGTSNLFGNMATAVFVLFAVRRLGLDPALLGLVYAGGSLGGVAGALGAQRLGRHLGTGATILVSVLAFSVLALAIPLAPPDRAVAVPLLVGVSFVRSLGSTTYNITQVSLRQAITPTGLLGRMNASMRFVVWGTMPFGSLAGGLLGSAIGLRDTLWVAGAGGLLSALWVVFTPLRTSRSVDASLVEAATV